MKSTRSLVLAAQVCAMLSVTTLVHAAEQADQFMQLALDCVHREYPSKIVHVLDSDDDVAAPRELYPVFYGCYDWHSAVHAHWLLVRLLRSNPESPLGPRLHPIVVS